MDQAVIPDELTDEQVAALDTAPAAPAELTDEQVNALTSTEAGEPPAELTDEQVAAHEDVTEPKLNVQYTVTPEELAAIAGKHGVDPAALGDTASMYSAARVSGPEDATATLTDKPVQRALWRSADLLSGGLIPAAAKKFGESDPNMRAAMDDLEELLNNKKHIVSRVTDEASKLAAQVMGGRAIFGAAAGAAGLTAEAAPRLLKAASVAGELGGAAAQGALGAKEGEETQDVILNTLTVGLLHGAGHLISTAKGKAAERALKQLSEAAADPGTMGRVEAAYTAAKKGEETLRDAVLRGAKKVSQLAPEEVKELANLSKSESLPEADTVTNAVKRVLGLTAEDEDAARAGAMLRDARKKLGSILGAAGGRNAAEGVAQQGEEYAARQFEAMRRSQYMLRDLQKQGLDLATEEGRKLGSIGIVRRVGMFLSDARHVYDAIDNRYGTELTPLLDKISSAHNAFTVAVGAALKKQVPLTEATRALADTETASGARYADKMWEALNKGEFPSSEFTPEQVKNLKDWRDHFNWLHHEAEDVHLMFPDLGLSPGKIGKNVAGAEASYVPHQLKEGPAYLAAVRHEMEQAGLQNGRDVFAAATSGNEKASEILKGLELWSGLDIMSPGAAQDAFNRLQVMDRSGESLFTRARALFKRGDEVPGFLLEKDVSRLASSWTANTYRHLFLRDAVGELARQADAISQVSPSIGQYIQNHVKDIAGMPRTGTVARFVADHTAKWSAAMEERALASAKLGDDKMSKWYSLLARTDDIGRSMMGNMYTYYLGLRPDAALRNLAQPFFMATPHLPASSPAESAKRIGRAYAEAFKDVTTDREGALHLLRQAGQLPGEQMFEAEAALREALGPVAKANGMVTKYAMSLYRMSDTYNRLVTKKLADGIIADAFRFAAGERDAAGEYALRAIQGASPGYRSLLERALREGDQAGAARHMEDFLIGHTQFNYNKSAMSEYGRALGPVFSMFSKWPTSVLGEILGAVDARSLGKTMPHNETRIVWKYLAPLFLAGLAQQKYKQAQDEGRPGVGLARVFLGADLQKWVPGDTLNAIGEGQISRLPPGAEVLMGLGDVLTHADPSRTGAALLDTAVSGLPFGVLAKQALLNWGPELAGEKPIQLKKATESGIRQGLVNPVRTKMGYGPSPAGR